MRAVILVGGKGARLMPLTKNTRKAYLPLGNKRVVDYIIDRLPEGMPYSISENDSGAVVAISEALTGEEPVMIIAGDNYFSESLDGFAKAFTADTLIGIYDIKDKEKARHYGVVKLFSDRRAQQGDIKKMWEKPARPKTTLVSTGLYLFPSYVFPLVHQFAKVIPDRNPGDLIKLIHLLSPVWSYLIKGIWFDIGTYESYREALEAVI